MGKLYKYGVIFRVSVQNQLAYLSGFISGFVFYAFVIFVFINLGRSYIGDRSSLRDSAISR